MTKNQLDLKVNMEKRTLKLPHIRIANIAQIHSLKLTGMVIKPINGKCERQRLCISPRILIFRNSRALPIVLIGFHYINNEFSYTSPADI